MVLKILELWSRLMDLNRSGYADNPVLVYDKISRRVLTVETVQIIEGKPVLVIDTDKRETYPFKMPSGPELEKVLEKVNDPQPIK